MVIIIINNFIFVGIIQHFKILQVVFTPKKLIKANYKPSKMKVLKVTLLYVRVNTHTHKHIYTTKHTHMHIWIIDPFI